MGLTIDFEGREWHFDKNEIGVDEWRELKRKYKMTPRQFDEGVSQADPDGYTFLYWVMLRQNGDQRAVLGDHLKPDIIALNAAIAKALVTEREQEGEEAEPDPPLAGSLPATTPSNGSAAATSNGSAPSTSSSLPATATSGPRMSGG